MSERRWSAWDLAEAFHLASAADYLSTAELLDDAARSAEHISRQAGLEPAMVSGLLNLLADRTDMVTRCDRGFKRGPGLAVEARAVIDQYVGAYGPNAHSLKAIMADSAIGGEMVDRQRHSQAYRELPGPGEALLPDVLERLGLGAILDLGCGAGGLLIEMACRDPSFRGIGVDANPDMIDIAEQRRRSRGIRGDTVEFVLGDISDPAAVITDAIAQRTETVVVASVLNEFFHPDEARAVNWLRSLRATLPHAVLVVADYYGALGYQQNPPQRRALHDWIQIISAQGIPPPTWERWETLYQEAGCAVAHVIEDRAAGVFVHFVRLADA